MLLQKKTLQQLLFYGLFFICFTNARDNHEIYDNTYDHARENDSNTQQQCYCDFCEEICATHSVQAFKTSEYPQPLKTVAKLKKKPKRTIIIYMAADNDLRIFAARNIQQMAAIGSNENINILVHLDIRITGNKKITRRYLVEKDKVLHIDPYNILSQYMDSGNPTTLISCCEWAIRNYPAEEYDLILWNHGTGVLEPAHGKIINPMDLFVFNPTTHLLELDRSIGFLDALNKNVFQRGICWDDTTGNYLSNKKLDIALETIRNKYMNGAKFGVIGFDACLMAMIEITCFIKKHAQFMASSQEVELGMGWKYDEVLSPFVKERLDAQSFACHIVASYEKTYQSVTHDYTFSAINLALIDALEHNTHAVATLLLKGLSLQKVSYSRAVKDSRNKHLCTHFDEPSYIDLHHFYTNLANNIKRADMGATSQEKTIKDNLLEKLSEGMQLIENLVVANTNGRNLKNAKGISIYFPERGIHASYKESHFLESNNWGNFLIHYLFG